MIVCPVEAFTLRAVVVKVAMLLLPFSVIVASVAVPSLKRTLPVVGLKELAPVELRVAVKVTAWPNAEEPGTEETSAKLVPA